METISRGFAMTTRGNRPIYLDYNATTPVLPEVLEAMLPFLKGEFGNPSSAHIYGRNARRAVDGARRQVAELIGSKPSEIVFTASGTESNNLAICGVTGSEGDRRHLVTSVIEHSSVIEPCRYAESKGWELSTIEVDENGCVRPDAAANAVGQSTALVTIMHSNNETGVVQPLTGIVEAAHRAGALIHTDAAQSAGKMNVDVDELGVDLLTIAGHKLYAPKGVGVLYIRSGTNIAPVLHGADHERGRRPGTENVACIVGLGKACAIAAQSLEVECKRLTGLRDHLWDSLREGITGVAINGEKARRLPNTLNIRFPDVRSADLLTYVPEIAASTGSACKEAGENPSTVLKALGLSDDEALGSMRLSLGRKTTMNDVETAARRLIDAWHQMQ